VRARDPSEGDIDVAAIRAEFPAFARRVNDKPLVYLDSASTTQKPRAVIDVMRRAFEATANIHRGVHALSVEATEAFEAVRGKVARAIGRNDPGEIVFVRGTTEAINLVAQSYGRAHVREGDEILVTELEHHSNLVPWQMLCEEKRSRLQVLPIDDRGDVLLERLDSLLSPRTRIVAVSHVSNSLGTVLPVAEIARRAKAAGAVVVVDGAQAMAHVPVDVEALGCDFYALSAHKVYGPTGVGVLWGRRGLLEKMPPWQGGGDMVLSVSLARSTYREAPHKFEAGTPDIVGVIGFGAALDWLEDKAPRRMASREGRLLAYATRALGSVPGLRIVGTPREKAAVISFTIDGVHPHDLGTALDLEGIAVRAGHHCAQPVMDHFHLDATVRASFGVYSDEGDVDALTSALERAARLLGASAR
jgi:cysteine desulfurase/selenocysteine lyase